MIFYRPAGYALSLSSREREREREIVKQVMKYASFKWKRFSVYDSSARIPLMARSRMKRGPFKPCSNYTFILCKTENAVENNNANVRGRGGGKWPHLEPEIIGSSPRN